MAAAWRFGGVALPPRDCDADAADETDPAADLAVLRIVTVVLRVEGDAVAYDFILEIVD